MAVVVAATANNCRFNSNEDDIHLAKSMEKKNPREKYFRNITCVCTSILWEGEKTLPSNLPRYWLETCQRFASTYTELVHLQGRTRPPSDLINIEQGAPKLSRSLIDGEKVKQSTSIPTIIYQKQSLANRFSDHNTSGWKHKPILVRIFSFIDNLQPDVLKLSPPYFSAVRLTNYDSERFSRDQS